MGTGASAFPCTSFSLAARPPGAERGRGRLPGPAAAGQAQRSQPGAQGASGPTSASSAVGRGSTTACLGAFWKHRA